MVQPDHERSLRTGNVHAQPQLGLVCITAGPAVRFRTITRTRFLALSVRDREARLRELYTENLERLFHALAFCHARGIRLYRATSQLFPMNDDPVGTATLESMRTSLAAFGVQAAQLGIRVVLHPEQFVVLNSLSARVVSQSIAYMEQHGRIFDLLGLPRSTWSAIMIHGGKSERGKALAQSIQSLPESVHARLALENDESAYSASEILEICHATGVPMAFDAHHHLVHEQLKSYDHPSVGAMTQAARDTWPAPAWQIVHISNGRRFFADARHSDLVTQMPRAFRTVPWIEVEAKGKERAIELLRSNWLNKKAE